MPRDSSPPRRDWILPHERTATPRQVAGLCAALCIPATLMAATFALRGYWPVLIFILSEQAILAAALLYRLSHTADYDRIQIEAGELVIEQARGRSRFVLRLSLLSTHMLLPADDDDRIHFEQGPQRVEVGQLANAEQRRQVASELCCCLPAACVQWRSRPRLFKKQTG